MNKQFITEYKKLTKEKVLNITGNWRSMYNSTVIWKGKFVISIKMKECSYMGHRNSISICF